MTEKVLFITDTFENLNFKKDTSILMIEEALKKEMNVFQCEINDLFVDNNDVLVNCREINSLSEDIDTEVKKIDIDLKDFKYCFMRKDPPVDEDYNNALHLLDLAKHNGAVIINGKPFPKTLARIPKDGDFKGNLAAGGKGVAKDITENQKKIAEAIAPILVKNEISFAGIDIVGKYLTEINITSPTCAREILDQTEMNPIEEYFKGL